MKNWKTVLFNNASIKLLSIIFALLAWTLIINIDDPYKTKTFSVQVETINENALKSVNKVYEVIEGGTAIVTVKGKKSIVDKLGASDIRATADLSDLSSVNAVAIVPSLKKRVNSDVLLECTQVLKVALENMKTKQVKVDVVKEGTAEDGYTIGECVARPNLVQVTGGESTIDKVDTVRVFLNIDGVTEDFTKRLLPEAYDKDGTQIMSSTLSYDVQKVKVTAHVLQNKTIPVKVKVTGEPAVGYRYVRTDCQPNKIEIAGVPKLLAEISEVTIPINISGMTSFSSGLEQNINIVSYFDEQITVLEEYQTLSLQIVIENLVRKNVSIDLSKIKIQGVGDGYTASFVDPEQKAYVAVYGIRSQVEELNTASLTAYVDCNGLGQGIHSLPIMAELPSECSQQAETRVKVQIRKETADNEIKETQIPMTSEKPSDEGTAPPLNPATARPGTTETPKDEDDDR